VLGALAVRRAPAVRRATAIRRAPGVRRARAVHLPCPSHVYIQVCDYMIPRLLTRVFFASL